MRKSILIVTAFIALFVSCKKEESKSSTTETPLTTAQLVQNKWSLVNVLDINYVGATTTIDYIDTLVVGGPNDYIDFKPNNLAYLLAQGEYDTLTYSIVSDSKIILDDELLDIAKLTKNEFVISFSERTKAPYYDNVINLKR